MEAELQIELIERPNRGPCLARVFAPGLWGRTELQFVSPTRETRHQAIEDAEQWAIERIGRELPVSLAIEEIDYCRSNIGPTAHAPRRAHDPAYGKNQPLATRTNWNLENP